MTPEQQEVVDLRNQGLGFTAIARQLGISRRSARERFKRAGGGDPAIDSAMAAFGLNTTPVELWLKNKQYSIKVRPGQKSIVDQLMEVIKDVPAAPPIQIQTPVLDDLMVIYPIFDAHVGLRAHAEISGEESDLQSSADRVVNAMSAVMAGAPAARRAVIINGGDFTHQTDDRNMTRRSGHILDVAGRNGPTVREGIRVITSCIEMALTKHEVVEYYAVPGNHDPQNWETITLVLAERYRLHDRVRVITTWNEFSVIEHGEVAIFVHHGDKRTPKDLAMFCSAEFPEVWGRTRYRVLMTGHLHHIKADEFPGIYWMQLPALAARDHHAASGGYRSHSLMMALGFDRETETTRNTVRVK